MEGDRAGLPPIDPRFALAAPPLIDGPREAAELGKLWAFVPCVAAPRGMAPREAAETGLFAVAGANIAGMGFECIFVVTTPFRCTCAVILFQL